VARMYELLTQAAIDVPVPGNANGSYMTMKSNQVGGRHWNIDPATSQFSQGLEFGASALLSGFAGVFCDQGMVIELPRVKCLHSVRRILAKSK